MGKPLSQDLRDRIHAHVASGHSRRDAARRFAVSASSSVKLLQLVERTGSTAPRRLGRPAGSGKLAVHMAQLIAWVEAEPDITMPELAAKLEAATTVTAHPVSLSKALRAAGFRLKKNAAGIGVRTR